MTTPQTERELLDAAIAAHAETLKWSPQSFAGADAIRAFESASGKYVHHLIASQTLTRPAAPDAVRGLVIDDVMAELERAVRKFPTWPTDPLHASGVVQEESGELAKAVLQAVYEPHKSTPSDVREEAIQTAAMAIRFLMSMDLYDWTPGDQHQQEREHAA